MKAADLKKYYDGKSVLLTGHTGFKGSWLTVMLGSLGAKVYGYALDAEKGSLYEYLGGDQFCSSQIKDVRDQDQILKIIQEVKPDYVFHLAAQALVLDGLRLPTETFDVNTTGTINVMEALRQFDRSCSVVVVTTDKVYRNDGTGRPYLEPDALGSGTPYNASKAMAEIAVESYRYSYFTDSKIKVATARAGNVIGGGDWSANRLFPDLVKAISNSETVEIRNPKSTRPWMHVSDVLIGYLILGAKLDSADPVFQSAWNFGPSNLQPISVQQVAEQVLKNYRKGDYKIVEQKENKEDKLLQLDSSKSRQELGWQPRFSSTEAIDQSILEFQLLAENRKEDFIRTVTDHLR